MTIQPLYMWAGGKRKLLSFYETIWPQSHYDTYIEPFFGGGAVFCWLHNSERLRETVLGDVNVELMGLLSAIKTSPESFLHEATVLVDQYLLLQTKEARKAWYYQQRQRYWETPSPGLLFVLMRLGFNGIWQTCAASNGLFGTPAGLLNQTTAGQIVDAASVSAWSLAMQSVDIVTGDYSNVKLPETPALIYLDPPYRDSFTTYGTVFGDEEQTRVAQWAMAAADAGHKVLFANRATETDTFFEVLMAAVFDFHYVNVVYTAGRRKKTDDGFEAKAAREFLAVSK